MGNFHRCIFNNPSGLARCPACLAKLVPQRRDNLQTTEPEQRIDMAHFHLCPNDNPANPRKCETCYATLPMAVQQSSIASPETAGFEEGADREGNGPNEEINVEDTDPEQTSIPSYVLQALQVNHMLMKFRPPICEEMELVVTIHLTINVRVPRMK